MKSSSRLILKDDQKLGLSGVITDITTNKHSEEALRNKDILLGGVAVATNILLIEADLNTSINETLELLGAATRVDRILSPTFMNPDTGNIWVARVLNGNGIPSHTSLVIRFKLLPK